jgi:hypothetical protein
LINICHKNFAAVKQKLHVDTLIWDYFKLLFLRHFGFLLTPGIQPHTSTPWASETKREFWEIPLRLALGGGCYGRRLVRA